MSLVSSWSSGDAVSGYRRAPYHITGELVSGFPYTRLMATQKPLRADAERNRRRVLDAAAELFAAKGLAVGLDEIARHAGVGVGTAYRRFPDKRELIEELYEDRVARMVALAERALAADDAWEGLAGFIEQA